MHSKPTFDHEKLDVYQLELSFLTWVTPLLHEVRDASVGFHREVCDQLDRASLSALLNTAEGNGKRQSRLRARYFDDARGSAVECAACLDALVAKRLTAWDNIVEGKAMLLRIVGMLTKLVARFDDSGACLRDAPDAYADLTTELTTPLSSSSASFSYSSSKSKAAPRSAPEDDGRARARGGRKKRGGEP